MKKKLYRNTESQKIAGVCAGIADYLDIDVTVIRLIWVLVTFLGGSGIIAYIVCAFIIPKKPDGITEVDYTEVGKDE